MLETEQGAYVMKMIAKLISLIVTVILPIAALAADLDQHKKRA